ncbi:MAG: molecular chaperone DnaJ [Alphaproteobacteria bacterium]|nr:molecular chaperone DnaJ [Alphaproteobacteria bacterium]
MLYVLVLGVFLFIGLGLIGYWLLNADPARIRRSLKWVLLALAAGAIAAVAVRGNVHFLWSALLLGLPFLLRARAVRKHMRNAQRTAAGPSPGHSSTVRTDWLEMTLDHDTGDFVGTVTRGQHQGATLESMSLAQLLDLLGECREDQESVRLLQTYLDRVHGDTWRENAHAGPGGPAADGDRMTREQALHILGLEASAGAEEIREAHRRLMLANHPDRGGSTYLASQINRAKETLLGAL